MLLLTWHGTILRVEQSQNRLIHAPLHPARPNALDFGYHPSAAVPQKLPGGLLLHQGPAPGTVHLRHRNGILTVTPHMPYPAIDPAPEPAPEHAMLPLDEADVALLRRLLAVPFAVDGEILPLGVLLPGFILLLGPHRLNLAEALPFTFQAGIFLPNGAGPLLPIADHEAPLEINLRPVPLPPDRTDPAAFHAERAATLAIDGGAETNFLPFTSAFSTRDWFYNVATEPPRTGRRSLVNRIHHQRLATVLRMPGTAPIVLTYAGVLHNPPGAHVPPVALPPGVGRDADDFFLHEAAFGAAPRRDGPHALLAAPAGSVLQNTILPLLLLLPHLPPDTVLLRPVLPPAEIAALAGLLPLFGIATPPIEVPPMCRVENLFWAAPCAAADLGADVLRAARARFAATTPPTPTTTPTTTPALGRRLFITAGVALDEPLRAVATGAGFEPIAVEGLSVADLARLFAGAQAIMAAHGPVLDHLLFCRENAQIFELTPDTTWRPIYSRMSDVLGLTHAVLPCKQLASGALAPDLVQVRLMLRLLQARL